MAEMYITPAPITPNPLNWNVYFDGSQSLRTNRANRVYKWPFLSALSIIVNLLTLEETPDSRQLITLNSS